MVVDIYTRMHGMNLQYNDWTILRPGPYSFYFPTYLCSSP
jgi:hypothetical protein